MRTRQHFAFPDARTVCRTHRAWIAGGLLLMLPTLAAATAVQSRFAGVVSETEWNFSDNILGEPNSSCASGSSSQNIAMTDFDFDIPIGADIVDITVEVKSIKAFETDDMGADVDLIHGGGSTFDFFITVPGSGENTAACTASEFRALSVSPGPEPWGRAWTADEINASSFGARITARTSGVLADAVRITVTYTAPVLAFAPASHDFGDVELGSTGGPMAVTLQNTGDEDATELSFSGLTDSGFEADTSGCGFFLAPGESCDVVVTFTPPAVGPASAELQAEALEDASAILTLTGNGVEAPAPELGFTPSSLDFGDVDVDDTSPPQNVTLTNTGDGDATGLTFDPLGGGFEADTSACGTTLAAGANCAISVTFSPAEPGESTATLQVGSSEGAGATAGLSGNGVGDEGFTPVDLEVDPAGLTPEANGLFEPGETVDVAPAWRNDGATSESLGGTASSFTGPEEATYLIDADAADYGLIEPGEAASCLDTEVCYRLGLDDPAVRPAAHWDASFDETLDDADGTTKTWTLHIGESFDDVPTTALFYPAIENLLHSGVTGGCADGNYCPGGVSSRSQMPAFVLRALEGADYTPPACDEGDERLFGDVPTSNLFCPWIEDLAERGVVSGCGDGNYCPGNPVTRAQMAIFLLKTLEGADYTPIECTERFDDVPCPSLFADWIEDLADRGITGGCTETSYCPGDPVTRGQMAVFVTRTFELVLYGP